MSRSRTQDMNRCHCGAWAPFGMPDGRWLCGAHWRLTPDAQAMFADRMEKMDG